MWSSLREPGETGTPEVGRGDTEKTFGGVVRRNEVPNETGPVNSLWFLLPTTCDRSGLGSEMSISLTSHSSPMN